MERKRFFQIIDGLAANWYIDTTEPVTSPVRRKDGTVVKGRRLPERAQDWTGPNWTGPAQIIEWQPRDGECIICEQIIKDPEHLINYKYKNIKCKTCGKEKSIRTLPFKKKNK